MKVRNMIAQTLMAAGAASLLLGPAVAQATAETHTLPNGCRITGSNGWYGGGFAGTQHVSNCSTIQAKLWTTGGAVATSYTSVPAGYSVNLSNGGDLLYSDHNGKGTSNFTAWGFRLY